MTSAWQSSLSAIARWLIYVAPVWIPALDLGRAHADPQRDSVAVLEYRSGAKGLAGIGERLAATLQSSASLEVITPQEARRRAGTKIDAEVAHCAGEPACIAKLGRQLGASDVLLVGVSQLGDLIVAMQRIDVHTGAAKARVAESLAPDFAPSEQDLLGWLRQLFPAEVFKRYGGIQIVADVAGAQVLLNDSPRGRLPLDTIRVRAPASYQVRVTKPGYLPFQARIDVVPESTVEVRATLVREAGSLPWFKRWYVWAAVGGTLAVIGASVAIYYGTRVDETPMGFIVTPPH